MQKVSVPLLFQHTEDDGSIDTVNMHFRVVQMRLDPHALLLMFTFSHKET